MFNGQNVLDNQALEEKATTLYEEKWPHIESVNCENQ
jgi:hypothetical protein